MSDPDRFLSRWSRRKREAAEQAAAPEKPRERIAERKDAHAAPAPSQAAIESQAAEAGDAEPVFDLSKLPSLDSIGPGTDIKMFLQPGVPASLSRAALRRAWSADPAIRDFVGLSENSWDFTAPDSVRGFGPLLPTDNVRELLAQVFGAQEPAAGRNTDEAQAPAEKSPDESFVSAAPEPAGARPDSDPPAIPAPDVAAAPEELLRCTKDDFASQEEKAKDWEPAPQNRRRHGGALPS